MRRAYQSDLSDAEWALIEPHLPVPKAPGRPRLHPLREILDAVFYVVRGGCAWRLLPHDFPPWKTVYHYFRQWRMNGTFGTLNAVLCERLRICLGRKPSAQREHRRLPVGQDYCWRNAHANLLLASGQGGQDVRGHYAPTT
jgi:transposase